MSGCSNKILYGYLVCRKYYKYYKIFKKCYSFFFCFATIQSCKTILSSWAAEKQMASQTGCINWNWLTPSLDFLNKPTSNSHILILLCGWLTPFRSVQYKFYTWGQAFICTILVTTVCLGQLISHLGLLPPSFTPRIG